MSETIDLIQKYPLKYFSYSQLNTFLTCPHTYKLTYLSQTRERKGNKYTELGSILHEIYERQGKNLIFESKEKYSLGKAKKDFNKAFLALKDNEKTKVYFEDKDDFIKLYQRGITALENYYELYSDSKPLYVERGFNKAISKGLPPAKSFIDRIDGEADKVSSWVITDYKNGGSPKSKDYLRQDFQMALYVAQVFAEFGDYPKAVQFVHPVPNKIQTALHLGGGVYQFQNQRAPVVEFSVSDTIIQITNILTDIIKAIEEDNFPLVADSYGCKNCFFYQDGTCQPFSQTQQGWANI